MWVETIEACLQDRGAMKVLAGLLFLIIMLMTASAHAVVIFPG